MLRGSVGIVLLGVMRRSRFDRVGVVTRHRHVGDRGFGGKSRERQRNRDRQQLPDQVPVSQQVPFGRESLGL
jgi:hypothetical protein